MSVLRFYHGRWLSCAVWAGSLTPQWRNIMKRGLSVFPLVGCWASNYLWSWTCDPCIREHSVVYQLANFGLLRIGKFTDQKSNCGESSVSELTSCVMQVIWPILNDFYWSDMSVWKWPSLLQIEGVPLTIQCSSAHSLEAARAVLHQYFSNQPGPKPKVGALLLIANYTYTYVRLSTRWFWNGRRSWLWQATPSLWTLLGIG